MKPDTVQAVAAPEIRMQPSPARPQRLARLSRWIRNNIPALVVIFASLCAVLLLKLMALALHPSSVWSGTALLVVVIALISFNARKKLPFIPLVRASKWMRFHKYAGGFAVVMFLLHSQANWPRTGLNILVATLFVGVSLSGIIGLVLGMVLPSRLTQHGEEIIFERIGMLRWKLRVRAEQLILDSLEKASSSTLADYYTNTLADYFDRPCNWWRHVAGSPRALRNRLDDLALLDRYLNADERIVAAQLAECIRAKDNLDHSRTCQILLKGWLFIHIPLCYALLIAALVHGALGWAFYWGGA